jgi:hypothetical protein
MTRNPKFVVAAPGLRSSQSSTKVERALLYASFESSHVVDNALYQRNNGRHFTPTCKGIQLLTSFVVKAIPVSDGLALRQTIFFMQRLFPRVRGTRKRTSSSARP